MLRLSFELWGPHWTPIVMRYYVLMVPRVWLVYLSLDLSKHYTLSGTRSLRRLIELNSKRRNSPPPLLFFTTLVSSFMIPTKVRPTRTVRLWHLLRQVPSFGFCCSQKNTNKVTRTSLTDSPPSPGTNVKDFAKCTVRRETVYFVRPRLLAPGHVPCLCPRPDRLRHRFVESPCTCEWNLGTGLQKNTLETDPVTIMTS